MEKKNDIIESVSGDIKSNKLVVENQELMEWLREIEYKNDKLERENKALKNVLKEIL